MTDFSKILDKAKELEVKMKESQEKIRNIQVEGTSGVNSVKVILNGDGEMIKLEISPEKIKISFNDRLDKEFIKNLSSKLYEWTNERWIILLSKENGAPSKKEEEIILKKRIVDDVKKSEVYKKVLEFFPDAELVDIKKNVEKNEKND